jgi:signal transduction protein with GAF and PtsI domain
MKRGNRTQLRRNSNMMTESKITIEIYKTVSKAIAHSHHLDVMTSHLCQLLVAALGIKACAIFVLDLETEQMELLSSFGLSAKYLSKGPLLAKKSIAANIRGEPVIISDVSKAEKVLQYPEKAKEEGIAAILSFPIVVSGGVLGALRLYHHESWHISEQDLDSLHLLADYIGLAMTYTSLLNVIYSINEIIQTGLPVNVAPRIKKT